MSLTMRLVFFSLTGLVAGLLSWPFAELILYAQGSFPSLLLFSCSLGIAIGIFMGGVFGTSEGIVTASGTKFRSGMLTGIGIGAAGGLIGFVAGQGALLVLGTTFFNSVDSFRSVGLPVSKAVGWAVFGLFLGVSEGVRSKSGVKVRNGILGGVVGGFIGGLAFEFIRSASPGSMYSRLLGLAILGLCIGLFYAFIELGLSRASMYLLNGKNKGKEFPINKKITSVGASENADICIPGYRNVGDIHAEVREEKGKFVLADMAGSRQAVTLIDDAPASSGVQSLEDGSLVRVGSAQFQFRMK
jgi:hypothetical protein